MDNEDLTAYEKHIKKMQEDYGWDRRSIYYSERPRIVWGEMLILLGEILILLIVLAFFLGFFAGRTTAPLPTCSEAEQESSLLAPPPEIALPATEIHGRHGWAET